MSLRLFLRKVIPFSYRVWYHILLRKMKNFIQNIVNNKKFAVHKKNQHENIKKTSILIFDYKSVLIKKIEDNLMKYQKQKISSLEIASTKINNIIIYPNEIFSFWKLVGYPSKKKGFQEGLMLLNNSIQTHTAGGICQISNGIYWGILNLGLEVIERHRHQLDLFPDENRKVPFGAGSTLVYNYKDLQFKNTLDEPIRLQLYLDDEYLHIKFYSTKPLPYSIQILEEEHKFVEKDGKKYRCNKLYQVKNNNLAEKQLISQNHCEVLY